MERTDMKALTLGSLVCLMLVNTAMACPNLAGIYLCPGLESNGVKYEDHLVSISQNPSGPYWEFVRGSKSVDSGKTETQRLVTDGVEREYSYSNGQKYGMAATCDETALLLKGWIDTPKFGHVRVSSDLILTPEGDFTSRGSWMVCKRQEVPSQ
jgi:hypothetical protein